MQRLILLTTLLLTLLSGLVMAAPHAAQANVISDRHQVTGSHLMTTAMRSALPLMFIEKHGVYR